MAAAGNVERFSPVVRVLPRLCCVTQDVEAHAQDTAPIPLETQGLQVFERAYSCCFPRVLRLLLMSCLRVVRQVNTGMWRSLVARVVRDDEVAGSNPVIPTNSKPPESNLQGVFCICFLLGSPTGPSQMSKYPMYAANRAAESRRPQCKRGR